MFERDSQKAKAKHTQLIISLKFHYSKTLSEMSLESALSAMTKVWQSCQESKPDDVKSLTQSSEGTMVFARQELDAEDPPLARRAT